MNEATVYLALGTNSGDRARNLRRSIDLLEAETSISVAARSRIYRTQSVEDGGASDFYNAALRLKTTLSPRQLLAITQRIESELGRPMPPRRGPRVIDIDILLWDDLILNEADLQIPHPRMAWRAFVLRPLLDVLEGGWVRPSRAHW